MSVNLTAICKPKNPPHSAPSSAGYKIDNAEAGLLTYSDCNAFPSKQRTVAIDCCNTCTPLSGTELTAAGTVADFHGFPF